MLLKPSINLLGFFMYGCGYINKELTLKDREWTCKDCNTVHDRDLNASIPISIDFLPA